MDKKIKIGITLALSTAVISGVVNFLSKVSVTVLKDATLFTFLKNSIVAILLIGIILAFRKWQEIKALNKKSWINLLLIGAIGGSLPFILYFQGLTHTSALTAGFIHKTLFIWVAILAVGFLKEKIGRLQIGALILFLGGNLLLGGFQNFHFGKGELMILAATFLWAIENIIAKKTLKDVSSLTVASARMVFGSVILLTVVGFSGKLTLISNLSPVQWLWTLIPSMLLLGYVLTWYSALKILPATVVASLLVPATFITTVLSTIFLKKPLTSLNNLSGVLVVSAIVILIASFKQVQLKKLDVKPTNESVA
jgi:drug/metabolite transporter (DMT)-like permease